MTTAINLRGYNLDTVIDVIEMTYDIYRKVGTSKMLVALRLIGFEIIDKTNQLYTLAISNGDKCIELALAININNDDFEIVDIDVCDQHDYFMYDHIEDVDDVVVPKEGTLGALLFQE